MSSHQNKITSLLEHTNTRMYTHTPTHCGLLWMQFPNFLTFCGTIRQGMFERPCSPSGMTKATCLPHNTNMQQSAGTQKRFVELYLAHQQRLCAPHSLAPPDGAFSPVSNPPTRGSARHRPHRGICHSQTTHTATRTEKNIIPFLFVSLYRCVTKPCIPVASMSALGFPPLDAVCVQCVHTCESD